MENQHRKIKGYRELNQEEIDLMNEIKEEGIRLRGLTQMVLHYNQEHSDNPGAIALNNSSESYRWIAEATTDLQKGIMSLVRAVAKPEFF